MNFFIKATALILLFVFPYKTYAQIFEIKSNDFKKNDLSLSSKVIFTKDTLSINQIINDSNLNWQQHKNSFGITTSTLWTRTTVKNSSSKPYNLLVLLNNHQLNNIIFYEIQSKKVINKIITGDTKNYNSRPINNRKFLYPKTLNKNESITLICEIENNGASMIAPIEIWETSYFYKSEITSNFLIFFVIIGMGFCFLIGLLALILLKKKIYGLYAVYAFTVFLFLLGDTGYLFQFFTGSFPNFHAFIRITVVPLSLVFLIFLSKEILTLKTLVPKINIWLRYLAYFFILYITVENLTYFTGNTTEFLKKIEYISLAIAVLSMIIIAFYLLSKNKVNKILVSIYLFAFMPTLVTIALFSAKELNLIEISISTIDLMYYSVLFEAIILGISILYATKKEFDEINLAKSKMLKSLKQYSLALLSAQENERQRIAYELHDGIGQNLLLIKNNLLQDSNATSDLLDSSIEVIRNLSQNLYPVEIQKLGLTKAIVHVINNVNELTQIYITENVDQIDDFFNSENEKKHLYRIIQEAINNIIKHSEATAAKITIKRDGNSLKIKIQDNGLGFNINLSKNKNTLGIRSIAERLELLNGTMNFHFPKKGTILQIEIKN